MKPDKNTINNLIGKTRIWTPCAAREILKELKRILPVLEKSDSIENEIKVINWTCSKDSNVNGFTKVLYLRSCYEEEFAEDLHGSGLIIKTLRACVQELDHYIPAVKAQIVDVALAEISDLAEKAEQIKEIFPKVKKICNNLDKQTNEIFTIMLELISIDTNICQDYYFELFKEMYVELSVLRNKPSFQPLVEAYDLAVSVSKGMAGGQQ